MKQSTNLHCANGNEIFVGSILEDDINMKFVVEKHDASGVYVLSAADFPNHPFCILKNVLDKVYVVYPGWD